MKTTPFKFYTHRNQPKGYLLDIKGPFIIAVSRNWYKYYKSGIFELRNYSSTQKKERRRYIEDGTWIEVSKDFFNEDS